MTNETKTQEFLSQFPYLCKLPDEWENLSFFMVDTSCGRCLILAWDEDSAERAAAAFYGFGSSPTLVRDEEGNPIALETPWSSTGGPMQYVDAVIMLEGDPMAGPLRAPDSSKALPPDLAMAIDAAGRAGSEVSSSRSRTFYRRIEYAVRERNRYLLKEGLLRAFVPGPTMPIVGLHKEDPRVQDKRPGRFPSLGRAQACEERPKKNSYIKVEETCFGFNAPPELSEGSDACF